MKSDEWCEGEPTVKVTRWRDVRTSELILVKHCSYCDDDGDGDDSELPV